MGRNIFIQMSKLTNVKGRINYISSHTRQENLYAVYETADRKYWSELAKFNQGKFIKSGAEGKCIEARELIIALPESFVDYKADILIENFTNYFKDKYGVECIAALHHNKTKTNYHIHLIFSERKILDTPIEKIVTRNMFYDEKGRRVRTKKEILDEVGNIRKGCKIIIKGEVYERKVFDNKDKRFKDKGFLDEVKQMYVELINMYVIDERESLQVFNKNSIYLPMKKIGNNNPKEAKIKEDNEARKRWNATVDKALVSGVTEEEIKEIKRKEIDDRVKESVLEFGRIPNLFKYIVQGAIEKLELLITKVVLKFIDKCKLETEIIECKNKKGNFSRKNPFSSKKEKRL